MPTPSERSDAVRFTPRGVSMRDDRFRRVRRVRPRFGRVASACAPRRFDDSTIRGFDANAPSDRDRIVFSFLARARRVDVSYATSRFAHVVRARSAIGRSAGGRSRRLAIGRSGGSLRATRTDGRARRDRPIDRRRARATARRDRAGRWRARDGATRRASSSRRASSRASSSVDRAARMGSRDGDRRGTATARATATTTARARTGR